MSALPPNETHAPGSRGLEGTVPLAVPNIGPLEVEMVMRAVESGFVSSVGPFVTQFEEVFAERVGARYAVACATGTAALHVGLLVLGVRSGDEVLCSDFTFIGSVNPIAYIGATPVFVDSELTTWNIDPTLVVEEIEGRAHRGDPLPAAVEVVHVLGQPADIVPILEVCDRHGVPVLEDAAEALGATWSSGALAGRAAGVVGKVGAYSFNGNKIATTGGGGMLVTDDEDLARRARHLTTQAKVPDVGYLHDEVGYNYRLTNIAAALGVAQLSRLDEFVARKRDIAARYDDAFADTGLILPPRVPGMDATYWLYSVLIPAHLLGVRDRLLDHVMAQGIGARALWRPLHTQPPYERVQVIGTGRKSEILFANGISLPCATDLSDDAQSRVIDAVLSGLLKWGS